jgi:anaerobic selenocysteine-containing dehydrogenase
MDHESGGFDCSGCAWRDGRKGPRLDVRENGIKRVIWDMTRKRAGPEFLAACTVAALSAWIGFALEDQGRLSGPLVYDELTDKYVPISWQDAFSLVGGMSRGLGSPDEASFHTSGHLSSEAFS